MFRHTGAPASLACGLFALVAGSACGARDTTFPTRFTVVVGASAPPAVRFAAADVASYLSRMGVPATVSAPAAAATQCSQGVGVISFLGDGVASAHDDPTTLFDTRLLDGGPNPTGTSRDPGDVRDPMSRAAQRWRIVETRCGEGGIGVHVALSGGGLFGRQYAAYDFLHLLGVRFFHPEQEFVPERPAWGAAVIYKDHTPPFQFRSVSLHLTHPLELGDPLRAGRRDLEREVKRYVDWQIKNLSTEGVGGVGPAGSADPDADLSEYGITRGFPRGTGFSLHGTQQGSTALVDFDSPVPVNEQIRLAIDARLDVADPAQKPRFFGFQFNPSEFTELPDVEIVSELTFIADYIRQRHPEVILTTINHGTYGAPTEHYGVRYYDLSKFAPANLGVYAHTLMFYDLFRPAPVYGNESFRFLYDFMVSEYRTRRLWYFPEAAWWLTFDVGVPLYLPITIEARDRDIQSIQFMLDGKLVGHRTFGTGHEWGYWQNEYCSLRLAADTSYRHTDCLRDITSPMGAAAPEVLAVLLRAIEQQERDIIYADILPYLVGTDPETEVAAQVGVHFHPLPPSPAQIARWELPLLDDFQRKITPQLLRMENDLAALDRRLEAVGARVSAGARPFFDEIRDGLAINYWRARHARLVYGAMVTARLSRVRFEPALMETARALLADAKAATEGARVVVRRREAQYRYHPTERSTAGGLLGTDDRNWTVYKYRYLNRPHTLYYYVRIDDLATESIAGGNDPLAVDDAIITPSVPLAVTTAPGLESPLVAFGDGASESGPRATHAYSTPGVYELTLTARQGGSPLEVKARVAVVESEAKTGFSAQILAPMGAGIIQGVLPSVVVGRIDQGRAALGFGVDATGKIALGGFVVLQTRDAGPAIETLPERIVVPIVNHATGAILTSFVVEGATVGFPVDRGSLVVAGDLSTQAVIDAIVSIGGFDQRGARALVASTLGFTPETLPLTVPLRVRYTVVP